MEMIVSCGDRARRLIIVSHSLAVQGEIDAYGAGQRTAGRYGSDKPSVTQSFGDLSSQESKGFRCTREKSSSTVLKEEIQL